MIIAFMTFIHKRTVKIKHLEILSNFGGKKNEINALRTVKINITHVYVKIDRVSLLS